MPSGESLFNLGLQRMVDRVAARFLESDTAPSGENAAAVHRSRGGLRLVDIAVRHQLIRLVAHVGRLHVDRSDLAVQREVPLLAVSGREVERTSVYIDEQVVKIPTGETNRREPARRTQSRGRIKLITRIRKAGGERRIEGRIVMAGILQCVEDAITGA